MMKVLTSLAVLVVLAAPVLAEEQGGSRLEQSRQGSRIVSSDRDCPKSVTSVVKPTNVAKGGNSREQTVARTNKTKCEPLVSTRVTVPTNIGVGRDSDAEQNVTNTAPNGSLRDITVTRSTNRAAAGATAGQRVLSAPSDPLGADRR